MGRVERNPYMTKGGPQEDRSGATGLTPTVPSLTVKSSMPRVAINTASRCDTPTCVRELSNRASIPRLPTVFTG